MRQEQKLIDNKLPLPWLIGSAGAIVFAMGGLFMKLESVSASIAKIEAKADSRDEKIEKFVERLAHEASQNDIQDSRIDQLSADIKRTQ